ncbi:U4/U6.U5 snRNP associated protein [Zalaria obscura]|uniref:U4/U6.U5 snRNP associated protein n=1 Tax=Zalaria obscura TaxID=2024903 RepID=A0ACC3SL21_9PEZI
MQSRPPILSRKASSPPNPTPHKTPTHPHTHTPSLSAMASKQGAYGEAAGDTSFRKTWDREEYAQKAAAREAKIKEEGRAKYEAAVSGKKYIRRASTPPDARETEARKARLDVSAQVGKTFLVPAGSATGKKGRGAGFYCESCDLTFKDNLQFVEHLNSKQHLVATGQTGEVRRATLEEVVERLAWLKRKRVEERERDAVDLGTRLDVAKEVEEREREERRRKRNEKRRKTKDGVGVVKQEVENDGVIC